MVTEGGGTAPEEMTEMFRDLEITGMALVALAGLTAFALALACYLRAVLAERAEGGR